MDISQASQFIIKDALVKTLDIRNVAFALDTKAPTALAYHVPFPRMELVLDGVLESALADDGVGFVSVIQDPRTALFVPSDCWNEPRWEEPVTTLSLLFGKQRLGFSLVRWTGQAFERIAKFDAPRRGPRTGTFILQALSEIAWRKEDQQTASFLVKSLISHALDLLQYESEPLSRSACLFEVVRQHIEENYGRQLARESVAAQFGISADYLSHLFQKEARVSFNDYLTHVRLEKAKFLLKNHNMKIKEVARQCGFLDSNYFCRIFHKKTQRSPSDYRTHYRSHINGPTPADGFERRPDA